MLRKRFLASVACLLAIVPALPAHSKPANWVKVYSEDYFDRGKLVGRETYSVDVNSISKEKDYHRIWLYSDAIANPVSGLLNPKEGIARSGILINGLVDCKNRRWLPLSQQILNYQGQLGKREIFASGRSPRSTTIKGVLKAMEFVCSRR